MSWRYVAAAWQRTGLDPRAKLVLVRLADGANDEGVSRVGRAVLADDCSISQRMVTLAQQRLVASGAIVALNSGWSLEPLLAPLSPPLPLSPITPIPLSPPCPLSLSPPATQATKASDAGASPVSPRAVIAEYHRLYIERRGIRPAITGRCAKAVKELLATIPEADIIAAIPRYLALTGWPAERGHPLWALPGHWNELARTAPRPVVRRRTGELEAAIAAARVEASHG